MTWPLLSLKSSGAQSDLEALFVRMERRLYPETIPVLASYWLKTVCAGGRSRGWWKELNELLKQALVERHLNAASREVLIEIQNWILQSGVLACNTPGNSSPRLEPFRPNLRPEWIAPYIGRLLNEWLSAEVASLLVNGDFASPSDVGIPVLAVGRALERLLVRERLSPETLEMFLDPELLSPQYVYPADAEMFRDVVLALLGRTWGPPLPVMPAITLGVAGGSLLPAELKAAVRGASFVEHQGREEIRVPIGAAEALEILKRVPMRVGSIIVTMDGRCWVPEILQSGEQHSVIYKPGERLRIDYSAEHAKLKVPCPDTQLNWSGGVRFREPVEIFGREWRASSWEADEAGTWLHLVFSRVLPLAEIQAAADTRIRRSRPAAVDIAWAAFGDALAASIAQKSREPIEQLRRAEFIPLGRAILGLTESLKYGRLSKRETIETQLRAIRYLQTDVSLVYGRVPWGILPARIRATFIKRRPNPVLLELLNETFDAFPEVLHQAVARALPSERAAGLTSPPQAA